MKTARLFFAAVCILILFAVSSCSRPALIVQIESEAPPLISAAEASPETVEFRQTPRLRLSSPILPEADHHKRTSRWRCLYR